MTLLLTGANGFVASHLALEALSRGFSVRGLVRRDDAQLPAGVERVVARSLDDVDTLEEACRGCTAVVHLAARVHVMREKAADPVREFRQANVEGTRSILEAAARARVRRLVFLSSIKVSGEGRAEPYTEAPGPPPEDPYGLSKFEAEGLVRDYSDRLETVILRPPLVYGPGVGGNFARLIRLVEISRRLPLPLTNLRNRRSMIFVGNLCDAILHLLESSEAPGRAFVASDCEDLSTADLVQRLGAAAGFSPKTVGAPVGMLKVAARLLGRTAEMDRLTEPLTVDPTSLLATGWRPPYSVEEGIGITVRWWQLGQLGAHA
jgi:nucleoside-diphosphate-sugar epimerase